MKKEGGTSGVGMCQTKEVTEGASDGERKGLNPCSAHERRVKINYLIFTLLHHN